LKVLVTGATGFIGRHLIKSLIGEHQLFCLARKKGRSEHHIQWIRQDFSSPLDTSVLPTEIDVIIHLAQSEHYREFPERSREIFKVNIESTLSLLEYGRTIGIKKFVYASSGGIYGYSYEKFIETDMINPVNFYLTSKYCSELIIANYNKFFQTVILRFFFVYGKGQKRMLVPRMISQINQGLPTVIYGRDGIKINPIYVDDTIKVFDPILREPITGVFNIAGHEIISIRELAVLIGALVGREPNFVYEKDTHLGDIIGDNSRMKSVLGVMPRISLKEGIQFMIDESESGE